MCVGPALADTPLGCQFPPLGKRSEKNGFKFPFPKKSKEEEDSSLPLYSSPSFLLGKQFDGVVEGRREGGVEKSVSNLVRV